MITALFAIAFMLPLCAADTQKIEKSALSQVEQNQLAWHLVLFDYCKPQLHELKTLCVVNKYFNAESSKILQPCRAQLKTFVEQKYRDYHCQITYSPDCLSAAIVEKTGLESTDNGLVDQFIYIYIDDALRMREVFTPYRQNEKKASYPPFFTPKYVCLDFGIDTTCVISDAITGGLCWDRSTKTESNTCFSVKCGNYRIPTEWFMKKLPHLYTKIMQTPEFFVCDFGDTQPRFHKALLEDMGFTCDLAKANILTPKDIKIVSNFVPGGKDAKWCEVKQEKDRYLLFNLVACYGKDTKLLKLIDQHVGKQTIKSSSDWRTFVVSTCRNIVACENRARTDRYDPCFSIIGQATLDYTQRLKKEGVFVEKDWKGEEPKPFKKRINKLKQALHFLKHKRMTFITQDKSIIRHDLLSNTVTVVSYICANSGFLSEKTFTVPANIDLRSLKADIGKGLIEYKTT